MSSNFDPSGGRPGQRPAVTPAPGSDPGPNWLAWQVVVAFLAFPMLGLVAFAIFVLSGGLKGTGPQPVQTPPLAQGSATQPPVPRGEERVTPKPPSPPKATASLPPDSTPIKPVPAPLSPSAGGSVLRPKTPRYYNPATGHDYQLIETPMSWREAKAHCEKLGGYLATATSHAENEFIHRTFAQTRCVWLGATDEQQEGKWQWVTGEPWGFSRWAGGEPSNHGNKEHYLLTGSAPPTLYQGRSYFYRFGPSWNDHEESGMYYGTCISHAVCEYDTHDPAATEPK